MPKRLIRRTLIPIPDLIQRHIRYLIARPGLIPSLLRAPVPLLSTPERTLHPLILVWALLIPESAPCRPVTIPFDPIAPPAAAARAEEPEKARAEGEGDADPDGHVDAVA